MESEAESPAKTNVVYSDEKTVHFLNRKLFRQQLRINAQTANERHHPSSVRWSAGRASTHVCGVERRIWSEATPKSHDDWLRKTISKIEAGCRKIIIHLQPATDDRGQPDPDDRTNVIGSIVQRVPLVIATRIRTWGGASLIVTPADERKPQASPNAAFIKALARAWAWREAMLGRDQRTVADVAAGTGFTKRYVRHLLQLAFLAPDLIATIVDGRQPTGLKFARVQSIGLPVSWRAQCRLLFDPADYDRPA